MSRLTRTLLIGPLTIAVGCGNEPTMSVPTWTVSDAQSVEIGVDDGVTLFQVVAVERTRGGAIVVGNRSSESILVFDSVGALSHEIGGPGRGPGEFEQLQGLDLCEDDKIVAWDPFRISIFEEDGSLVRTFEQTRAEGGAIRQIGGVSADCGSILVVDRWPQSADAGPWPHRIGWQRLGGAVETLEEFPGRPMIPMLIGSQMVPFRAPYGAEPAWDTDGSLVVLGLGTAPEVWLFGRGTSRPDTLSWPATPPSLSPDAREQGRLQYEREVGDSRSLPPWDDFPLPDTTPYYLRVMVADSGRIWVQEYPYELGGFPEIAYPRSDTEPQTWLVLAPDTGLVASVVLPQGFDLKAVLNATILGVQRDRFDVESVRSYRVQK